MRALDEADRSGNEQDARDIAAMIKNAQANGEARTWEDYANNLARSISQGVTFGFGDELAAAGDATVAKVADAIGISPETLMVSVNEADAGKPWSEIYEQRLKGERDLLKGFRETNPVSAIGGEIAGAMPTAVAMPFGAVGRLASTGSLPARIGAGAAIGATQGGIYGFGAGEDGARERVKQGALGSVMGGALGAAAPAVGSVVRGRAQSAANRAVSKVAPTSEELRSAGRAAYQSVDNAGIVFKKSALDDFYAGLSSELKTEGLDKTLHPKVNAVLTRFEEAAADPLQAPALTTMRKLINSAAGSVDPDERRLGMIMKDKFDDLVDNLSPDDVAEGFTENVADAFRTARESWSQMRKSEIIEEAIDKASNQASGLENGIRIQLRQILQNPKRRRGFTEDEIRVMEEIARGTLTSNTLRRLGRLSMGSGVQTNVLGGLGGSAAGGAVGSILGGPVGAAIGTAGPPAVGYAAQRGAERLADTKVRLLRALVASGGELPKIAPETGRSAERITQRLAPTMEPIRREVYQ